MRKLDLVVDRALVLALVLGGCCSTRIPSSPSDMVGGGAAVELNVRNFTANTGIYLNQAFLYLGTRPLDDTWHGETGHSHRLLGELAGYCQRGQPGKRHAGYVIFTFLESG